MVRSRKYLDIDVLEAARARTEHIYSVFDNVVVMWSGGKDSSACLLLAKEVCERYDFGPVKVVFRDEEVINFSVLRWVEKFMHEDWIDLQWHCITAPATKFVLGNKLNYTAWDPEREWVHEMPEWAMTNEDFGLAPDHAAGINERDLLCARGLKGSVAFITGIRASESLMRFRSVSQKLNENYINKIEGLHQASIRVCRPIYDWMENDVLKYLHDTGMGWCSQYDAQELAGQGLRISTPLHSIAAKNFDKVAKVEPEFYQKVIDIFPEMLVQERYWKEFDQEAFVRQYSEDDPDSFAGVFRYIEEHFPESSRKLAYQRVRDWKMRRGKDPDNYPINLLLRELIFSFHGSHNRLAGKYVDSKSERAKRDRASD